jgi:hypothetical protein
MALESIFDPKTMTDDELFTRQVDLGNRRAQAARMARPDLLVQLDIMIQAIDLERRERMFVERWNRMPDSPVVLETDPAMQQDQQQIEERKIQSQQPPRPIRRTIRSSTPVLPTEGT